MKPATSRNDALRSFISLSTGASVPCFRLMIIRGVHVSQAGWIGKEPVEAGIKLLLPNSGL